MRLIWCLIAAWLCMFSPWLASVAECGDGQALTTVKGRVTDIYGGPIPGALVSVTGSAGHALGTTTADNNGAYSIKLPAAPSYRIWAGKSDDRAYRYIPQVKEVPAEDTDFRLLPGASLLIDAYDGYGRRLDDSGFRQATDSRIFFTDLSGRPAEGTVASLHHKGLVSGRNETDTVFVIRPDVRYRILVQWEVPQVGKLLYTLDNGGAGYRVDGQGRRLELNLNLEIARSSLSALRRVASTPELRLALAESERHLNAGRSALSASPADFRRAALEFDLSVKTSLEARERAVMAQANIGIERYRKGDLVVTVTDAGGRAIPGLSVDIRQIANDFAFGANPLGDQGSYNPQLASMMRAAGFNQSYITARWGLIEQRRGEFDWSNIDAYQHPAAQQHDGFALSGALSLWLTQNEDFSPSFLRGESFAGLQDAVYRYIFDLAGRYAGKIDVWEVNELNLDAANAFHLDWQQKLKIAGVFARAVKDANPQAKILNGSLALPFDAPSSAGFSQLVEAGVPMDILGLELYQAGVTTSGSPVIGLDVAAIDRLMDEYGLFGKPISIKEFSVPSAQVAGSSWWHRPWDEDQQAEFATDIYTIAFSKQLVHGITWSWGVCDRDAFIQHGGLIDSNLKPKKAYSALKTLLASWRTSAQNTTDREGRASFRGFAGTYEVTLRRDGVEVASANLHLAEQQQTNVTIRIPASQGVPSLLITGLPESSSIEAAQQ